jgi:hypothetical protein
MFLGPAAKNAQFFDIGRLIMEEEAVGKTIGPFMGLMQPLQGRWELRLIHPAVRSAQPLG